MKKIIFWLLWLASLWGLAFAQPARTPKIPKSIQASCLLTSDGYIDTCPQYREIARNINYQLYKRRSESEQASLQDLFDQVQADAKKPLQYNWSGDTREMFFAEDYTKYITDRFKLYLDHLSDHNTVVYNFFQETYFDADHSWLQIENMSLYSKYPQQYDRSVVIELAIRNYSTQHISDIEDLYCFTTLNDKDYIYPLNITPIIKSNSITNIIIEIFAGTSPLFEKVDTKKIACTMVYFQNETLQYTNRGTLQFNIKEID